MARLGGAVDAVVGAPYSICNVRKRWTGRQTSHWWARFLTWLLV